VPFSTTTTPFSSTAMRSQFCIVLNLCATTMLVLPTMTLSNASCTTVSDWLWSALMASSSRRIAGFLRIALAIAMRFFCPPDRCMPRSPYQYHIHFFRLLIKSCALPSLMRYSFFFKKRKGLSNILKKLSQINILELQILKYAYMSLDCLYFRFNK
jgi:hypothetical protein